MLLQSQDGMIALLPAVPESWPSGSVTGLRARNNVSVDIEWEDGKVSDYKLRTLDHKKDVVVVVNGEKKMVTLEP